MKRNLDSVDWALAYPVRPGGSAAGLRNIKMKDGPAMSLKTKEEPNSTFAILLILRRARDFTERWVCEP